MNITNMRNFASDFCRYAQNADDRIIYPLADFYKGAMHSPSVARLLLIDETKKSIQAIKDKLPDRILKDGYKQAMSDYQEAITNLRNFAPLADQHETIKPLLEEYISKFKEVYPKTATLRMKLMDTAQVVMDEVNPKMGFFKKLLFWRNSVPKEYSTELYKKH